MAPGLDQTDRTQLKLNIPRTQHHYYHHHHYHQQKGYTHHSRSQSVSHQGNYSLNSISMPTEPGLDNDEYVFHRNGFPGASGYYRNYQLDPLKHGLSINRPRSANASLYSPTETPGPTNGSPSDLLYQCSDGVTLEDNANCNSSCDDSVLEPVKKYTQNQNFHLGSRIMGALGREFDAIIRLTDNNGAVPGVRGQQFSTKNLYPNGLNREYISELQESRGLYPTSASTVMSKQAVSVCQSEGVDGLIAMLPYQRRSIVAKRGAVFTLMVTGESGLGKTTLLNTLFNNKIEETGTASQSKVLNYQPLKKTTQIEARELEYEESGFTVKFTLIDTPGFGDYTNNTHSWVPIVNYIDDQHKLYMLQEEQPDRSQVADTRVHVCLYFIRPSGRGLLPLDIKAMQELSVRVNLIPVISKADSFTLKDREQFKIKIRNAIQQAGIKIYCPEGVDAKLHPDISEIPYAVIASNQIVNASGGRHVRGRQYQWGVAEVENEQHCDFIRLRRVLMEKYMLDLIDSTAEKHYERYRKECMLKRIKSCQEDLAKSLESNESDSTVVPSPPSSVYQPSLDGGLDTLVHISRYGREYLEKSCIDTNPIYRERHNLLNEKYAVMIAFHDDRFEAWRAELRTKQSELNDDIEKMNLKAEQIKAEIEGIEAQRRRKQLPKKELEREPTRGLQKVKYKMRR